MSTKQNLVKLSGPQRTKLKKMLTSGTHSARKLKRARILLACDVRHVDGRKTDAEAALLAGSGVETVRRLRKRFNEDGFEASLGEKPRPGRKVTFTGKQRGAITALACSEPPEGASRWSLRLLASRAVELDLVDSISHTEVGRTLKKTNFSLIANGNGVSVS